MTTPVDNDFEIIENIEGDLFVTCAHCDPPQLIYKDKLAVHEAFKHGRPLSEVFEEEDRDEDEDDGDFF